MVDYYTRALDEMHALIDITNAEYQTNPPLVTQCGWTHAFVQRMYAHTRLLDHLKVAANKSVRASLDHSMVETLSMLLTSYLRGIGRNDLVVHAERTIPRKRVRPDISVWKGDACVAVVEAKVQMGWSRHNVEQSFIDREAELVAAGVPHANIWHVVASQCNWERKAHASWGSRWRVVAEQHTGAWQAPTILHPIDEIFVDIGALP